MTLELIEMSSFDKMLKIFEINQDFMTSKATESGVVYCCSIVLADLKLSHWQIHWIEQRYQYNQLLFSSSKISFPLGSPSNEVEKYLWAKIMVLWSGIYGLNFWILLNLDRIKRLFKIDCSSLNPFLYGVGALFYIRFANSIMT